MNDELKSAETIACEYHQLECGAISECCSGELIVEEPLLITMAGKSVVTLMCTPGDEISLTLGYLLTEGIISSMSDIGAIAFCREEAGNVVRVIPAEGTDLLSRLDAYRTIFSSCSICGREAIQAVTSCLRPFTKQTGRLSPEVISELGKYMNSQQRCFRRTGGTHAAALGQIKKGRLVAESVILKEDIGRHNALDKAVGEAVRRKTAFGDSVVFLSGRMSFEIRAKTREKFVEDLAAAGSQSSVIGDESLQQPVRVQTEEETTEQAALTQIHVLRDQRKTIGGGHKITLRLLDELDIASAHVDDLKTMIVQETIDDPKARTAMLKAVSLPGRAAVMRDLAQAARTWVGLERQAFGIVEEKRDPNKPIDSENLSAAELLAEIAQEMQQLGVTPEMLALPRPMANVIEGVANKPVGANGANGKDKH